MESAKEDQGVLAIEDITAKEGALVAMTGELLPYGPPTTYGPQRREETRKKDGKGQGEPPERWKSTHFGARLSRTKLCSGP